MKLIIDIPEDRYKKIKEYFANDDCGFPNDLAIAKGIPLEEHGRLIDADVLCDYFWDNRSKLYTRKDLQVVIDRQPTIIEADKESE